MAQLTVSISLSEILDLTYADDIYHIYLTFPSFQKLFYGNGLKDLLKDKKWLYQNTNHYYKNHTFYDYNFIMYLMNNNDKVSLLTEYPKFYVDNFIMPYLKEVLYDKSNNLNLTIMPLGIKNYFVQFLKHYNINVNTKCSNGSYIIHYVCQNGWYEIIPELLDMGMKLFDSTNHLIRGEHCWTIFEFGKIDHLGTVNYEDKHNEKLYLTFRGYYWRLSDNYKVKYLDLYWRSLGKLEV